MIDEMGAPTARTGWTDDATRIDQVVYAWSRRTRTGGEGYYPVASSMESAATRSWNSLLAAEVEIDESRARHPSTALAYVVGSSDRPESRDPRRVPDAALIHRIRIAGRGTESSGRIRAHVLIGRADYLTERVGLALYAAGGAVPGGSRANPRLPPLHLADLAARRRAGERSLRQPARAEARRASLARLIGGVLAWSGQERPFSIMRVGSDEAVALMWAMVEILEGVLPYRLTFSTHSTGPDRAGSGPRFRFAPFEPDEDERGAADVIHLDPRVEPGVPPDVFAASQLLAARYSRGGIRAISDLLALVGDELFYPDHPERWCHRVLDKQDRRTPAAPAIGGAPGPAGPPSAARVSPANPANPADPATAAESAEPAGSAGSAESAEPAGSAESAESAAGAIAVVEYLHEQYERGRATNWVSVTGDPHIEEPLRRLVTALTAPVGLPSVLASIERLRRQLHRVAGLLAASPAVAPVIPGSAVTARVPSPPTERWTPALPTDGPQRRPAPSGPGPGAARPGAAVSDQTLRDAARDATASAVRAHLTAAGQAGLAGTADDVAQAVAEEQRQVESSISALADELAELRVPVLARNRDLPLERALPLLADALESLFAGYRLADARASALRLATETVEALRASGAGRATNAPDDAPPRMVPAMDDWRRRLAQDAAATVTRHVHEAYLQERSSWNERMHPVDRLLAALGVPLGVSPGGSLIDPLGDPLESPTELRELAALRDLLRRAEPATPYAGPLGLRPAGRRADVLARAASQVTQAITRSAPSTHQNEADRAAYVDAVHGAVAAMQSQVVETLARLVADLAELAARPTEARAAREARVTAQARLISGTLRELFARFELPAAFDFAEALSREVAWIAEAGSGGPDAASDATQATTTTAATATTAATTTSTTTATTGNDAADAADADPPDGSGDPSAEPRAESDAGRVVRLLRETHASGSDAFRLLVLYAPAWHDAEDLRASIIGAGTARRRARGHLRSVPAATTRAGDARTGAEEPLSPDAAALAAGARPYFDRLLGVGAATGRGDELLVEAVRRVLGQYEPDVVGPDDDDLADLHAELTERILRTAPEGPDPATAFLRAGRAGQSDAARTFGLLARYVPSWDDDLDVREVILRDEDGSRSLAGPALGRAAERYFRRAAQGTDPGSPYPADLERLVRRMIAIYLADEHPRLQAARELPAFVEERVIAGIDRDGPPIPERLSLRLSLLAITFCIVSLTIINLVR